MRAIVVIPTYNERANLAQLVEKILQFSADYTHAHRRRQFA